jgi:hypothetical protein
VRVRVRVRVRVCVVIRGGRFVGVRRFRSRDPKEINPVQSSQLSPPTNRKSVKRGGRTEFLARVVVCVAKRL